MHDCLLFHDNPSLGKQDIINNVITFGDSAMLWGRVYPWKPPRFRTCKLSNAWRPFNPCSVIGERPYMSNFPSAKLTSRAPNQKTSCWINLGNFSRFLGFMMRTEKVCWFLFYTYADYNVDFWGKHLGEFLTDKCDNGYFGILFWYMVMEMKYIKAIWHDE